MAVKNNGNGPIYTLNCKGKLLTLDQPKVMGILNTTPDSFYSGSRRNSVETALPYAEKLLREGADLLDIGAQSTRPGSERVGIPEEIARITPVIRAIHQRFPEAILSVDTYYSDVAKAAIEAGAHIVNDISSGSLDANMIPSVAALGVPYVAMHMQGTPDTMTHNPVYHNIATEVLDYFIARNKQLTDAGIRDIIVDPGFGFGKTIRHNFQLMNQLEIFHLLQRPLLVGISRKSTIWKTLRITPEEALNGTTVLNTIALLKNTHILRVHDVLAAKQAIELVQSLHT